MRRGQIEIMAQILALCLEPRRKTRIQYLVNLSYDQVKTYIALLTSKNLLAHNSASYITTDRGYRFLEAFASFNDVLENRANEILVGTISKSYEEVKIVKVKPKDSLEDIRKILTRIRKTKHG